MHPDSQRIIAQILAPAGGAPAPDRTPASTAMTIEQIIRPRGVYTGPERRAQGMLVAEVVPTSAGSSTPASAEGV